VKIMENFFFPNRRARVSGECMQYVWGERLHSLHCLSACFPPHGAVSFFRAFDRKLGNVFILYYKLMPTHVPTSPNFINDGGPHSLSLCLDRNRLQQTRTIHNTPPHKDRTCEHNVNMKFNRNSLLKECVEGPTRK
jgi:hypothetical protein